MKKSTEVLLMTVWAAVVIILTGILFTACNKSDNNDDDDSIAAGLMGFNLVPEAKTIGFIASDRFVNNNPLPFNSYTGGYLPIPVGSVTLGAVNFFGGGVLASNTFSFEDDKYYSVFLVGADPTYEQVIVRDNFESLASGTQAFVRYINAIPDASSPTVTIAANGTNVVNESALFKAVSGFTAVDPGSVTVTVSNGGTINTTRTITLETQKVYTILLSGKPGNTGETAVQIKYIQNATVDATTGRASNFSSGTVN